MRIEWQLFLVRNRGLALGVWLALAAPFVAMAAEAEAEPSDDVSLCQDLSVPTQRRLEACDRLIEESTDAHARFLAYLNRADVRFTSGRGDLAFSDISKAIGLEPDNADGYWQRARFNYDFFDYENAALDLSVLLRKKPDDVRALRLRAHSYARVRKHALAIADYDAALKLQPDHADTLYARAFSHEARRDYARARADFERAVALDPSLAGDFPSSCFETTRSLERRLVLANWPKCEREAK